MADQIIAAVCISDDGILLTRNKKHFERVNGLKLSGSLAPRCLPEAIESLALYSLIVE